MSISVVLYVGDELAGLGADRGGVDRGRAQVRMPEHRGDGRERHVGGEGDDAEFKIKNSCVRAYPFRYTFTTVDGTATGGLDYTSQSGTLTIPHAATQVQITVETNDDSACEATETFKLQLEH